MTRALLPHVLLLAAAALQFSVDAEARGHAAHSHGQPRTRTVDATTQAAQMNASAALPVLHAGMQGPAVARAQILLDQAWFSPGEIDGSFSTNMRRTVAAFQASRGLGATGKVDAATWSALGSNGPAPFATYTVSEQDLAGPFTKTPADMMERAKLKSLDYESVEEALAERFHMSQKLLLQWNRGRPFTAGQQIVVADATAGDANAMAPGKAKAIVIRKSERVLFVVDTQDNILAAFPVSIGGPLDPLPLGKMKITNEVKNPMFTYDPALIKTAKPSDTKVDIQPGPNNPVGNMWLGLSKPHWGIHGTPNPSRLGREETNGCVHLTNWDAQRLATIAKPGFVVDVRE